MLVYRNVPKVRHVNIVTTMRIICGIIGLAILAGVFYIVIQNRPVQQTAAPVEVQQAPTTNNTLHIKGLVRVN